jgi:quinol monooxygenase YgiN
MSVVVIVRLKADENKVREVLAAHAEELEQVSKDALAAGAISHRFVAGSGEVLIIDEWNDAPSFQGFFGSNKAITQLMMEAGVSERPSISIYEPIDAAGTH